MQVKGWFTHQEIDARAAANLRVGAPNPFPLSTLFSYEEFNNGGADVRFRKFWGDDTIFRGSALTFGGVVYHGDAPFQRYTLTEETSGPNFLFAPRGTTSDLVQLDQSRTSNYQSIFIEDLVRIGKFHMVGSFRLDHEDVEVDSAAAPWLVPVPSGDWYITRYLCLIAGISNLSDEKYYDRVFANGIEPAPRRSGYAGLSLSF